MLRRAEKNHRMSAFALADIVVPKDFHEIAGLRLRKIGKVPAEPELVKQTRGAGTVRIPASPNAFTIVLIANDELVESCVVKFQLAAGPQHFDGLNKDDVGRARAKTGIRRSWDYEEFSRFKMRSRLQLDFGEVRDRIFAAGRHFAHLLENQRVVVGPASRCDNTIDHQRSNQPAHARNKRRISCQAIPLSVRPKLRNL